MGGGERHLKDVRKARPLDIVAAVRALDPADVPAAGVAEAQAAGFCNRTHDVPFALTTGAAPPVAGTAVTLVPDLDRLRVLTTAGYVGDVTGPIARPLIACIGMGYELVGEIATVDESTRIGRGDRPGAARRRSVGIMDGPISLFPLSPLCDGCAFREICGADRTARACRERQGPDDPGGEHVLHPTSKELVHWVQVLGGLQFDDMRAQPAELPKLPAYTPQLRNRRALRGGLAGQIYAIRASEVLRRGRVLSAAEIRLRLGLRSDQLLLLLLFDRDKILERLWDPYVIRGIAAAGFDAVTSPSYSAWSPRPRTETLANAKRSLSYFTALQLAGAQAIPRVVWEVERDVSRYAAWANDNRCVQLVALDLQTYRLQRDWALQLAGLARFDRLTGGRLSYLINGPTTVRRCKSLFGVVPPERVHITNSTSQLGLRSTRDEPGLARIRDRGQRFDAQTRLAEARLASARAAAVLLDAA